MTIRQYTDSVEKSIRKVFKQSQTAYSLKASLGLDDLRHFVEEGFAYARLVVTQLCRRLHFRLYLIGAWSSWHLPPPMEASECVHCALAGGKARSAHARLARSDQLEQAGLDLD